MDIKKAEEISELIEKKVDKIIKEFNGLNHSVCSIILREISEKIKKDKNEQNRGLKFYV